MLNECTLSKGRCTNISDFNIQTKVPKFNRLYSVSAPVRWSWQGIDRSLVASARAVKQSWYNNFIITTFDCQGGSQGGGISAIALAHPGVAPPLFILTTIYSTEFTILSKRLTTGPVICNKPALMAKQPVTDRYCPCNYIINQLFQHTNVGILTMVCHCISLLRHINS